jgi:uncharacterized membrane protein SpoIIM required for sporulation
MSPLQFEQQYQAEWTELEQLLAQLQGRLIVKAAEAKSSDKKSAGDKSHQGKAKDKRPPVSGDRLANLYRRACEQLALARARAYPAHIIERLDQITGDAHQAIYSRREFGAARFARLITQDFPRGVRDHARYVWLATAVFVLPMLVLGVLVYSQPELILSVVDPQSAARFEDMYSIQAESIGRERSAETDMEQFGRYILNNISVAFQCFASGLILGVGSLYYLAYNGVLIGAVAGYLTERGLAETFYSFVVTHAAFELTAIVLAGAAGLRIGHSILAPGRQTRTQSLVTASRESIVIIYGAVGMLLIAAAIEAFWSSAKWIPPLMKYGMAAVCWIAVLAYLTWQGRRAS